jgi:allantoin racemase
MLASERGAESVYLGGAVFAGMAEELRDRSPIPLIDGISCGVKHAETLARLNLKKPVTGSYLHPARKDLSGTTESLRDLYKSLPE